MLATHTFNSPLGQLTAGASQQGICLLAFGSQTDAISVIRQLERSQKSLAEPLELPIFQQLQQQLDEYFKRQRQQFELPLDLQGTEFQQQAWQALQNIPYGATRSYKEQATALQRPTAVRAVAQANRTNKLAIIVPCHRVIGSDGSLTGYAAGIERKRWLLELEAA